MHSRFDDMESRLEDVRVRIGDILSHVSNEAPRIYSLRPVDAKWWDVRRLTNERVEVQVWCEEANRPVPGAVEVVTFDLAWVKYVRQYTPYLRRLLELAASAGANSWNMESWNISGEYDLESLRKCTNGALDGTSGAF